jgi:hypothetical protein
MIWKIPTKIEDKKSKIMVTIQVFEIKEDYRERVSHEIIGKENPAETWASLRLVPPSTYIKSARENPRIPV